MVSASRSGTRKTSSVAKRKLTRKLMGKLPTIRSLASRECPPGMISRKAYTRKYSTAVRKQGFTVRRRSTGKVYRVYPKAAGMYVESRCVKDLGLPGKGPREGKGIGRLRKGELKRYGYSFRRSEAQRHAALQEAVRHYGATGVYRKLNAVAKLTMRTIPSAAKTFGEDRNWVRSRFGV